MSANYNGWRNYATWRVNLEVIDGLTLDAITDPLDLADDVANGEPWVRNFADQLKEYCGDILEAVLFDKGQHRQTTPNGVEWADVVRMFVDVGLLEVDWKEIALHVLEENADLIAEAITDTHDLDKAAALQMIHEELHAHEPTKD